MNQNRSIYHALDGALVLVLATTASIGMAQTPLPAQQPVPPARIALKAARSANTTPAQTSQAGSQQDLSGPFFPGTQSEATYPLPNGTLTVYAGMPAQVRTYGSPPAFAELDSNHDGRISEWEAQAYPPIDSDFLYASGGTQWISRSRYEHWVTSQH